VIRFFVLSGHYRMPINFSAELLLSAENALERISNSVMNVRFVGNNNDRKVETADIEAETELTRAICDANSNFVASMDDDLNTADAITAIFELVRAANTACTQDGVRSGLLLEAADEIVKLSNVLGIAAEADMQKASDIPAEIMELVEKRMKAKETKNYTLSDEIRDQVTALGFQIKDTPQGPQVTKL